MKIDNIEVAELVEAKELSAATTAEKLTFVVFYSWQSDLNPKTNQYFIGECIQQAISQLNKEGTLPVKLVLDQDVRGSLGSIKIAAAVFEKIEKSDLLISDVSIINGSYGPVPWSKRKTPNPNVLIELGFGVAHLSWERVICIHNSVFSNIADFPFDIRGNRIFSYKHDGRANDQSAKRFLTRLLKDNISKIVWAEGVMRVKGQANQVFRHDQEKFRELRDLIGVETEFLGTIESLAGQFEWDKDQRAPFKALLEFFSATKNEFVDKELLAATVKFKTALGSLLGVCAVALSPSDPLGEYNKTDVPVFRLASKNAFRGSQEEYQRKTGKQKAEITKGVQDVYESYVAFRKLVKEKLLM